MNITALGMIETSGLLSAIEAADAGLKAADVRLLGTDYVRGGLVMVRFEGEVAAVQAAVDAGTMAAQRIGNVVSSHVIPRAMPEVFCMLASDVGVGPARRANDGCANCGGCEGGMREARACAAKAQPQAAPEEAPPAAHGPAEPAAEEFPTAEAIRAMRVTALRSLARKLPGLGLTANDIRYANKEQLIEALLKYDQNQ